MLNPSYSPIQDPVDTPPASTSLLKKVRPASEYAPPFPTSVPNECISGQVDQDTQGKEGRCPQSRACRSRGDRSCRNRNRPRRRRRRSCCRSWALGSAHGRRIVVTLYTEGAPGGGPFFPCFCFFSCVTYTRFRGLESVLCGVALALPPVHSASLSVTLFRLWGDALPSRAWSGSGLSSPWIGNPDLWRQRPARFKLKHKPDGRIPLCDDT